MKLFYEDLLIGEVMVNHSMSMEIILELLENDMNMIAEQNDWDDWNYEKELEAEGISNHLKEILRLRLEVFCSLLDNENLPKDYLDRF